MCQKYILAYTLCLLLVPASSLLAEQSLAPDLDKISKSVENYFRQSRPDWEHKTVPPATPPGSQPSPNVVIHFWSSDKCLTAEVITDGVSSGERPVPCRVKLAIDQSPSAAAASARLADFAVEEQSASPVSVGEQGYVWHGSDVVFVKGKFTFWVGVNLDRRAAGLTKNREFTEELAKEIADAVPAT